MAHMGARLPWALMHSISLVTVDEMQVRRVAHLAVVGYGAVNKLNFMIIF